MGDSHENFARHWAATQPVVASFLATAIRDYHESEDLLQNVAVVCFRNFESYDPRRPFVAWALGMARIEVLRHRRKSARLPIAEDPALLAQIVEACEDLAPQMASWEAALAECLKELKGRAQNLIHLRYIEALKPAAISRRLGLDGVAVRVALTRVRAGLRRCVESRLRTSEGPS